MCNLFGTVCQEIQCSKTHVTIHKGTGEIVTYLEYLVGRNSCRYRPSHPSLYRKGRGVKRIHDFGHATVTADSMGDILPPRGLQQETLSRSTPLPFPPASTAQPHPWLSPYPTGQISQPLRTANNQVTVSQEIMLKLQLKRLV